MVKYMDNLSQLLVGNQFVAAFGQSVWHVHVSWNAILVSRRVPLTCAYTLQNIYSVILNPLRLYLAVDTLHQNGLVHWSLNGFIQIPCKLRFVSIDTSQSMTCSVMGKLWPYSPIGMQYQIRSIFIKITKMHWAHWIPVTYFLSKAYSAIPIMCAIFGAVCFKLICDPMIEMILENQVIVLLKFAMCALCRHRLFTCHTTMVLWWLYWIYTYAGNMIVW